MGEYSVLAMPFSATPWWIQLPGITILAVVGVGMAHLLLTRRDSQTTIKFATHVWPQLAAGNMAVAVYYGLRVVAVFGTVAYLMGRFA